MKCINESVAYTVLLQLQTVYTELTLQKLVGCMQFMR